MKKDEDEQIPSPALTRTVLIGTYTHTHTHTHTHSGIYQYVMLDVPLIRLYFQCTFTLLYSIFKEVNKLATSMSKSRTNSIQFNKHLRVYYVLRLRELLGI